MKTGEDNIYYTLKDYFGSIMVITSETGTKLEEYSYDAWGRRRNIDDWTYSNVSAPTYITRGYTGHEHIEEVGLINMNGRVYDPVIGIFLSPDNYVQAPDYTQNFNRYGYALNNPLMYTDPSGDFILLSILAGAAISAAVDYGIQVAMNHAQGLSGREAWIGQVDFFDVAISGVVGGLTGGTGALAKTGIKTGGALTRFLTKPSTLRFVNHGSKVLSSSIDFKPSQGLRLIGRDEEKSIASVASGLAMSYGINKIGKSITDEFTTRAVRRKAISYHWALRDGASPIQLDKLRTDYELSKSLNELNQILYKMRPKALQLDFYEIDPVIDFIKAPVKETLKIEWMFNDIEGHFGNIYWY